MPQIFVSYPREYRDVVERLVVDLRSSGYDPFFDEQLAGGQLWWDELLSRIEACTAFAPIIGPAYLNSTPCQLEAKYAAALGKPFLPIAIEATPPQLFSEAIASAHWTEYDPERSATVFAVIRAINELPPPVPLPPVMPTRPVVPISYMTELQNEIGDEQEIARSRQIALIADLKGRLKGPDKEAAMMLLRRIRQRSDVTYQAAVDIDELLARFAAPQGNPPSAAQSSMLAEPHGAPQAPLSPKDVPRADPSGQQQRPPPGPQSGWSAPGPGPMHWPGQPVQALGGQHPPKPDNYYLWTILSCLLCCIPVGIVGIVYSSRVDALWAQGKVAEALDASSKAKMWAIISAVCGVITLLIILGSAGSGA